MGDEVLEASDFLGPRPTCTSLDDLPDLPIYTALTYLGVDGLSAMVSSGGGRTGRSILFARADPKKPKSTVAD
jgi:hypothetical protein